MEADKWEVVSSSRDRKCFAKREAKRLAAEKAKFQRSPVKKVRHPAAPSTPVVKRPEVVTPKTTVPQTTVKNRALTPHTPAAVFSMNTVTESALKAAKLARKLKRKADMQKELKKINLIVSHTSGKLLSYIRLL